jgi:hypothetical protein
MRALVLALLAGCMSELKTPPAAADAQAEFEQSAWPALQQCVGCHGAQPTIDFLAPGTADGAYMTLFAFQPPVVDVASPSASLLLTMGKHTGPALDPSTSAILLAWLEREHEERVPPDRTIAVGPVQPQMNVAASVDLSGGTLGFIPVPVGSGLYLTQLAITAGPAGLHVVHPLFVSHPIKRPQMIDELDRFGDVDATLAPGEVLPLGGGEALFLDFDPSAPLTIHFHTLEAP